MLTKTLGTPMEEKKVTVVITPRDRYTLVIECIESLYALTPEPFDLKVLDLGYPKTIKKQLEQLLASKNNAEIYDYGRIIPMEAIRKVRDCITALHHVFR